MKIDIHAKNMHVEKDLSDFINKKVGKLMTFHSYILDTAVYLKDEGVLQKEVQLKLNIKNQTLVCKEKGETYEQALERTVDAMKRLLEKSKQK